MIITILPLLSKTSIVIFLMSTKRISSTLVIWIPLIVILIGKNRKRELISILSIKSPGSRSLSRRSFAYQNGRFKNDRVKNRLNNKTNSLAVPFPKTVMNSILSRAKPTKNSLNNSCSKATWAAVFSVHKNHPNNHKRPTKAKTFKTLPTFWNNTTTTTTW